MKRINHIVSVAGKLWMMESMAAARHADMAEHVDVVVAFSYRTREAVGESGARYDVYLDNTVRIKTS